MSWNSATNPAHKPVTTSMAVISRQEFAWIKDYLYKKAGIVLNDSKQALVSGRLDKRLRHYGLNRYRDYFDLFNTPGFELETAMAIDLLTTNETYFLGKISTLNL